MKKTKSKENNSELLTLIKAKADENNKVDFDYIFDCICRVKVTGLAKFSKPEIALEKVESAIEKSIETITISQDGKEYKTIKKAQAQVQLDKYTKPFRTRWIGAWKNNDCEYAASPVISKEILSILPDAFKVVIKRNDKYLKGSNRPNYTFSFAGLGEANRSNEITSKDLQYAGIEEPSIDIKDLITTAIEEGAISTDELIDIIPYRLYTRSEVQRAVVMAAEDGTRGYTDVIVEDYL